MTVSTAIMTVYTMQRLDNFTHNLVISSLAKRLEVSILPNVHHLWCAARRSPHSLSQRFQGVNGGGESTGAELVRESEGYRAALQFGSIQVREGGRRRHAMRRRGRMGGRGLGILRKEKGPRWAGAGPQRPGGPERSGGLKRVDGP
jgi:hypothetical protein